MSDSTTDNHVIVASDDLFAMPLTVAAASVIRHATNPERLRFTVIDCGFTERNRERIRSSLSVRGARVTIVPFTSDVPDSALQNGVIPSVATFARLFAADYVADAGRAVYLDSDTVIRTDVVRLLDELEPGYWVAGVVDAQGDGVTRNIDRLRPLLDDPTSDSPYINAGVIVLDLAAWRAEGLSERFRNLVATTPLRFADQDAINVVCAGHIQSLAPQWNTQTHLLDGTDRKLLDEPSVEALVVHYTQRPKPWHLHGDVGLAEPWFETVDLTAWKGWRPTQRRLLVPKLRRGWRMLRTRPAQLFGKLRRQTG